MNANPPGRAALGRECAAHSRCTGLREAATVGPTACRTWKWSCEGQPPPQQGCALSSRAGKAGGTARSPQAVAQRTFCPWSSYSGSQFSPSRCRVVPGAQHHLPQASWEWRASPNRPRTLGQSAPSRGLSYFVCGMERRQEKGAFGVFLLSGRGSSQPLDRVGGRRAGSCLPPTC